MTDSTYDVAWARTALSSPAAAPDQAILGAVHHGLLRVGVDSPAPGVTHDDEPPQLAVRRREAI